jgi:hypothetical protein
MPEVDVFRQQRNSLICFEINAKWEIYEGRLLACYCQGSSRLLTFSHFKKKGVRNEAFSKKELK